MGVKKSGSGLNTGAALVAAAFRGGRLRLNSEARSPGFFYLSSRAQRGICFSIPETQPADFAWLAVFW